MAREGAGLQAAEEALNIARLRARDKNGDLSSCLTGDRSFSFSCETVVGAACSRPFRRAAAVKLMPRTASTRPVGVSKVTCRSSTVTSGCHQRLPPVEAGLPVPADAVSATTVAVTAAPGSTVIHQATWR